MPKSLNEAATIRARARGLLKAAQGLLAEKTLPATLRKQIEGVAAALSKTWKDLEADAKDDPEPRESAELGEAAILGNYLEARLHSLWTSLADDFYGSGYLSRAERIALSVAIGSALEAFTLAVMENAPGVYQRGPWDGAPAEPDPEQLSASEGDAQDLASDCVPLVERAVGADGRMAVKLITPGWGSSGYYAPEVLERDGPKVFRKGLHMYVDHPTRTEEAERPERSVRDLAATLTADAQWRVDHPSGPGLYAEAQVQQPYRPLVEELAPHIGLSIRARGKASPGTAEGKAGPIISEIVSARSVDLVTVPGRGGEILQLFEAKRSAAHAIGSHGQEETMSEAELKKLQDANAQLEAKLKEQADIAAAQAATVARLQEAALLREAGEVVAVELAKTNLPNVTRQRMQAALSANPPAKDGALDREALGARITEAVKAEQAYLAAITGANGQIRGMGSGGEAGSGAGEQQLPALEESQKRTAAALARIGFGKAGG
jgi:hypothetical protein